MKRISKQCKHFWFIRQVLVNKVVSYFWNISKRKANCQIILITGFVNKQYSHKTVVIKQKAIISPLEFLYIQKLQKMSNGNGDRRRVSEHYPTLDTEQLIKPINGVITYFQSFDWSEPWLYILICFYILLYTFVYITRRNSTIQSFTFLITLLVVYMAEDLNEFLSKNHRHFTQHQYFDSNGMFISIVMSTPLLLASGFIAANWFKLSTELMTQVKTRQIQQRMRKQDNKSSVENSESENKKDNW